MLLSLVGTKEASSACAYTVRLYNKTDHTHNRLIFSLACGRGRPGPDAAPPTPPLHVADGRRGRLGRGYRQVGARAALRAHPSSSIAPPLPSRIQTYPPDGSPPGQYTPSSIEARPRQCGTPRPHAPIHPYPHTCPTPFHSPYISHVHFAPPHKRKCAPGSERGRRASGCEREHETVLLADDADALASQHLCHTGCARSAVHLAGGAPCGRVHHV